MTTTDDRLAIEKGACFSLQNERKIPVPEQLEEANELLNSINRRLEDCALEWQADVSRKQWKIFHSKANGIGRTEQSLLARTYFAEKNLDQAFQHLLSCNKIFSEYMKNFIDLLRGELSVLNMKEAFNVENQHNTLKTLLCNRNTQTVEFCSLKNRCLSQAKKVPDHVNNVLNIQNSFTDVIKAKVNFDTKFLGFEAVLHKATSVTNNTICLCEYCNNVVATDHGKSKRLRNISLNQRSQAIRRSKRLARSAKTLSRKKGRPTIIIGDASDQISFGARACIC